jgi:CO/xanthine dehydrogenase Mo-binding subunit
LAREGRPAFNPARARGVLEAVREMSAWDRRGSLPKGTGKGVAFQFAHAGYVAYVIEVSVDAKKAIKVNRAWCAVDIGRQTWGGFGPTVDPKFSD